MTISKLIGGFGVVTEHHDLQLPACCRNCGGTFQTDGVEWFMDTGYMEEFFGAVYYCNRCFKNMALAAGFQEPDANVTLKRRIAGLERSNEELEQQLSDIKSCGIDIERLVSYCRTASWESKSIHPAFEFDDSGKRQRSSGDSTSDEHAPSEGLGDVGADSASNGTLLSFDTRPKKR